MGKHAIVAFPEKGKLHRLKQVADQYIALTGDFLKSKYSHKSAKVKSARQKETKQGKKQETKKENKTEQSPRKKTVKQKKTV